MKRRVFISDELESMFLAQGYILLDFLDSNQLNEITQSVKKLQPADQFKGLQNTLIHPQSFHCTFFDENQDYKNAVFQLLNQLYHEVLKSTLLNYKTVQANIFLKPPHTGEVSTHQNLTIVDEDKFTSVSLWCPLIDVCEKNGALKLVPGSHGKFAKFRNTNIVWPFLDFFRNDGSKYLQSIEVKAGQLLILDDSIIHSSPPNHTDFPRTVLHILAAPEEASPIFCSLMENEVSIFAVAENFWQTNIPGAMPPEESPILKKVKYSEIEFSESEFLKMLQS